MDGGMLSQEEINALLNGGADASGAAGTESEDEVLTDAEKDAVGEISNISMGTAATTLFSLVNQRVNITTPIVTYSTWDELSVEYDRPCVFIQISYQEGLDGNNILVLKERDVKIITDLMMGNDGTNIEGELTDIHLSAISEAMNQMMGSAATSISSMLEKKVDISPPRANIVDLADSIDGREISDFLKGKFIKVAFHMEIGDLVDSELMQLYPFDFARDLYRQFMKYTGVDEAGADSINSQAKAAAAPPLMPTPQTPPIQPEPPAYNQAPSLTGQPAAVQPMMPPGGMQMQYQGQQVPVMPQQDVNIAPVQFQAFTVNSSPLLQTENIDLLLDVPLEVTVELGRTTKSIKEILDFAPGTIIELNHLAGEPIDVLVNGKYVARGEVMVIEDAFGIKVTEIIK